MTGRLVRFSSRRLARVAAIGCVLVGLLAARSATAGAAYDGIPVGHTSKGDLYLGSADAPVTMDEWSDYGCPYCGRHVAETFPLLVDRFVRSGKLRIVLHDFPIASLHPTSATAHVAAACAGEQGADRQWQLRDAIFRQQAQWTALPDPAPFLAELARGLGIDVERLASCMARPDGRERVEASVRAGEALGLNGTPSFRITRGDSARQYVIDGAQPVERFAATIDALLEGRQPPAEPAEPAAEPAGMPRWATPEGLTPDPKRPGYTVAGDPYRGSPSAKVTVIEFIDFQCPPCRTHAVEAQPAIDAALVATGKVRWVSKQLPLRVHPQAMVAAVAAECAGDQGRYWEMHDALFRSVADWSKENPDTELVRLASASRLDVPKFEACLNSRQGIERVLDDMWDARGFVERTPSFAIVDGSAKGALSGPLPAEQFIKLLDKKLEAAAAPAPAP